MRNFFGRMSFPRVMILACSSLSLVLGGMVWEHTRRLNQVRVDLKRVPEIVKEIQADGYRLNELMRTASAEKFKSQSAPETYIRQTAVDSKTNIGQVDIAHSDKMQARNIKDDIFKITPQLKTQRYSRAQIGNFLYKLEADSHRVKVTHIKLTPFEKVAPGEIGKDSWVFEADMTTRTKTDTP